MLFATQILGGYRHSPPFFLRKLCVVHERAYATSSFFSSLLFIGMFLFLFFFFCWLGATAIPGTQALSGILVIFFRASSGAKIVNIQRSGARVFKRDGQKDWQHRRAFIQLQQDKAWLWHFFLSFEFPSQMSDDARSK